MAKQPFRINLYWLNKMRFSLLLLTTVLTLILPAFSGQGLIYEIMLVVTLSFLFIQSTVVANVRKSKKLFLRIFVISMIVVTWLKPIGIHSIYIDVIKLLFFATFFIFVMTFLIKFIIRSSSVDINVLITSINIYLLAGIIGASLAMVFYSIYPDAYNFPSYINAPTFVHFLYYSFVTMSTVGYGDITPRIPETQTLAYLISITGQLYVAIIIGFLIGKYLIQGDRKKTDQINEQNK